MDSKSRGIFFSPVVVPLVFTVAYWLLNTRRYFFDDEFFTLRVIRESWGNLISALIAIDVHPPVSYVLYKLLFGTFGENAVAGQIMAILCVAAGLVLCCAVLIRLFPSLDRWLLFLAFHPLLLLWGGAARYYPVLFLMFFAGTFLTVKILEEGYRVRTGLAFIVISVLGIYTEFMYFLAFIPQCALLLYFALSQKEEARRRQEVTWLVGSVLAVGICYIPWISQTCTLIFMNMSRYARPTVLQNIGLIVFGSFLGQSVMPYSWPVVVPAALLFGILSVYGIRRMVRERARSAMIWGVLTAGAFLFAVPIRLLAVRHYLFFPCLFLVPTLYALSVIPRKGLKILSAGLLAAVFLYADANIALKREFHKAGLSDPVAAILQEVERAALQDKDSKVVLYSPPIDYYMSRMPSLKDKVLYLDPLNPEYGKILAHLVDVEKPSAVVFLWNYYGVQPDYQRLDAAIQNALQRGYALVSEKKMVSDERLEKLKWLSLHKETANPYGYRYGIKRYLRSARQ